MTSSQGSRWSLQPADTPQRTSDQATKFLVMDINLHAARRTGIPTLDERLHAKKCNWVAPAVKRTTERLTQADRQQERGNHTWLTPKTGPQYVEIPSRIQLERPTDFGNNQPTNTCGRAAKCGRSLSDRNGQRIDRGLHQLRLVGPAACSNANDLRLRAMITRAECPALICGETPARTDPRHQNAAHPLSRRIEQTIRRS